MTALSIRFDDRTVWPENGRSILELPPRTHEDIDIRMNMKYSRESDVELMTEAVYRAFGALPPPIKEPSLLYSGNPSTYPR